MSKNTNTANLRLAGVFILVVCGLIVLSLFVKLLFLVRDSHFDGSHNFIVGFMGNDYTKIASFSPQAKTISILDIDHKLTKESLIKNYEIPLDGAIAIDRGEVIDKNIPTILLKAAFPLLFGVEGLTPIDAIRLSTYAKGVRSSSIYERSFSSSLNDSQKATLLSLSLSDPTIFGENQTIQIINATNVYGLGSRLANLISNIGGNPVLVTTADKQVEKSKIIYYQDESYTVKRLSNYLYFPAEKGDKRGITDVIIVIGKDSIKSSKF